MSTILKRLTASMVVLALALGFLPAMGMPVAPQAVADEQEMTEIAPMPPAETVDFASDADSGLLAQASYDDQVNVSGAAYYDFAHEVLAIVNKERKALGLGELVLDYSLTEAAMQRAAEQAILFSHTRPDGSKWSSAVPAGKAGRTAENIAAGQATPAAVMESWFYEERENYITGNGGETGHYLSIINPEYKSIGIGCFAQGVYYWEQMFSSASADSKTVQQKPINKTLSVNISYNTCAKRHAFNLNNKLDDMKTLVTGKVFKMSYDIYNDGWDRVYGTINPSSATWRSSNSNVCTVSADGLVTAVAPGTATITATLPSGRGLTHTWTVSASIANTNPTVPAQTYTGSAVEPSPSVVLGGKTLVRDVDYTVSYSNNVNVGQASMTITGIGAFSGTKEIRFTIMPASMTSITSNQTVYVYDGKAKKPGALVSFNGTTLTENRDYVLSYSGDGINPGTYTVSAQGLGNFTGTISASYQVVATPEELPADVGQVMYRLYNPNSGEHFYTASAYERDSVISAGWQDEGIGWTAPAKGIQVYRLYNQFAGEHHYTTSQEERDMLVSVGWIWEEGGWYSDVNETVPLYRAYNPNAYANNHHYTTDWGEFVTLLGLGWINEGVGWHGIG